MAEYDPSKDIPFGIAGADFPVTFYDRPQLAFGNLLKGNIDAATRAIFSPQTLTPNEMKTVRDTLYKGKKPGLLMKTITDVATNPLVILGLIVGMKYPVGSTKVLLDLRRGLMPKAAAMSKAFSGLHGVMMNTRTVPGLWESLHKVERGISNFTAKHGEDARMIFAKPGRISHAEGTLVAMKLDGLGKATHPMVKMLRNEPEWIAHMGGKDVAIAPNLQRMMGPRLTGLSDKLRGWFTGVRGVVTKDPQKVAKLKEAVERKGMQWGETVEDYWPRQSHFNKYYKKNLQAIGGKVQHRKYLDDAVETDVSGSLAARTGGGMPELKALIEAEKQGAIKAGFVERVYKPIMARRSRDAAVVAQNVWDDVAKMGLNESQARVKFVDNMRAYYTKGPGKNLDFVRRLGHKQMANETLDAMAGSLQDATFQGKDVIQKELFEIGRVLAEPAQYSMNPWRGVSGYINNMAKSYAWHGQGYGDEVMKIMDTPGAFKGAPWLKAQMLDDVIPHIQGKKSYQELRRSIWFSSQKEKVHRWVTTSPIVEQVLGPGKKKWLMDYTGDTSALSFESVSSGIAHSFYLSTLGLNPSPVAQNSLQNFLTTIHLVGPQGIWRGLMGVRGQGGSLKKMQSYVGMRASGVASKEAFQKAFPEYVKDMGESAKIVESMLAGDIAKEGMAGKILGVKSKWEKVRTAMLTPFSTSESMNRIVGYYAGRNQHLFQNSGRLASASAEVRKQIFKEAGQVGQTLSMTSHFTGGPLGIPKMLTSIPAPLRQFMHFPSRYAAFLHGSLRMGPDPTKLDWGTVGRTMAGSTAAYIGAKNLLGIDLSAGLATGALPIPTYEGSPFYPFPMVPPVVGLVGTIAKGVLTGSAEELGSAASLLVPGGIAARKAYRTLAPRFADYRNRTPEGRIPLYNDKHALIGSLSPWQLTLRAMGLKPAAVTAEQGAAQWLLTQREKLRAYRRDYLQALMENDNRKAERVQNEFQKAYPELGPLQVKKSDIRALENRREISRLHRIERGIPSAYRPLFSQVIGEASLARVTQDIETGSTGLEQYLQ